MIGKVIDCIEIKGAPALQYGAAGVVVMVKHTGDAPPAVGEAVLLVRPDGWLYRGHAEDVRFEATTHTTGFFLRGLHGDDVPLEAEIRWGGDVPRLTTAVA